MSIEQNRAAAREREAAKIFGSKRVIRKDPKRRAPDVEAIRLPNGDVLQLESKNGMKRCPRTLVKAMKQARSYTPGSIPVAIFSDVGGEAIACMPAKDMARLLGVAPEKLGVQLTLPFHATAE